MLYRRSLISELGNQAGAVFVVLLSIVITVGLVQVLGEAAGGKIDPGTIFEIAVYSSLVNLAPLLTLSFFISVLMVLMRYWRDNEMVVWFSSGGLSLLSWIRPVLVLALPAVLVTGLLSTSISPWARGEINRASAEFSQRDDVNRIAPGRFIETMGGRRVFFIESLSPEGTSVGRVFVSDIGPKTESIVTAQKGSILRNEHGDRYISFEDGTRWETHHEPDAFWRVLQFERYGVRVDIKAGSGYISTKASDLPFSQILAGGTDALRAELFWRLSWPMAALCLALLAIPLSFFNPRGGRNLGYVIAGLIFILYLNSLSICVSKIEAGRLHWLAAYFLVHGAAWCAIVLSFLRHTALHHWQPAWLRALSEWVVMRRRGARP